MFEKIVLRIIKWYLSFKVRQGPHHRDNIVMLYALIVEATENEFTDDNKPTINKLLLDCHAESLTAKYLKTKEIE